MIEIEANGERRSLPPGTRLLDFLVSLGRDSRTVAVEYNGEILPRALFAEVELKNGDRMEIVHFVQGG